MKYKLLVFDMDGTLADTSEGIISSHKHANLCMGRPVPSDAALAKVIGAPLLETYRTTFSYSATEAEKAVAIYRDYYSSYGINQAALYDAMPRVLQELKARGYFLAVATLKAERFALQMLDNLGIIGYFDAIHGVDEKDTLTKAMLIELCMKDLQVKNAEAVLIGDSIHDAIGAKAVGAGFIAATYGFGFKTASEISSSGAICTIQRPLDLLDHL